MKFISANIQRITQSENNNEIGIVFSFGNIRIQYQGLYYDLSSMKVLLLRDYEFINLNENIFFICGSKSLNITFNELMNFKQFKEIIYTKLQTLNKIFIKEYEHGILYNNNLTTINYDAAIIYLQKQINQSLDNKDETLFYLYTSKLEEIKKERELFNRYNMSLSKKDYEEIDSFIKDLEKLSIKSLYNVRIEESLADNNKELFMHYQQKLNDLDNENEKEKELL